MVFKFDAYIPRLCRLICFCLCAVVFAPLWGHAEILDALCPADDNSPVELKPLVEEAEATGMPTSTLNRLLVKGYQDETSKKALGGLLCIIVRAEEDGLPPDLLFEKLVEGLGKGASIVQIVTVVQRKVNDMQFAQGLVSDEAEPKLEDDNVTRIAKVMSAGLSRRELMSIFRKGAKAPVDMRVVAAEIKGYGRTIGYDTQLLDQIVDVGLTSQALTDEWFYFVKVISKARKQEISDQHLATEAVKTLTRRGSLDSLIENLGMTPAEIY